MPCLPCTRLSQELTALNDCYPPSKELVKAGPEYQPLSQDLGKLKYIATNKPSSLAKIGDELEKRVNKEAKGSSGGYPKSRASLLISLRILHRLLIECKRDLGLFARQTMRIISTSLDVRVYQKNDTDLEVASRAAACFAALATFTDGGSIGVDDQLTNSYLSVLGKFANLSCYTPPTEKVDTEEQSRARLIGLSALSATAGSDAMFSSSLEFPRQVKLIVPALLKLLHSVDLHELKDLASKTKPGSQVAYFSEFQAGRRPVNDRRLPSLHDHVPGEKGPSPQDVTSAAYRCLYNLVSECQANQAEKVLGVVFAFLDRYGWNDVERCCWLVEQLTAAMMLQSRSIVPTALVDILLDMPDDVPPSPKHVSVVAMVTTVLSSSVSLVGLGVTDILASLIAVITRRVTVNPRDELLPALVKCVSSLGTHIYYTDQINDIVEEIAVQMAAIPNGDPARQDILRVLIHCIVGVMSTADVGDEAEARASELRAQSPASAERIDKGKSPQLESGSIEIPRRDLGRRNPIAPEVWQETLPLLCESTYAVRAAYARALLFYLTTEMPRDRRPRPDEPNIVRFCNALNASIYTLAMSSRLGVGEPIPSVPATPGEEAPIANGTGLVGTPRSMTPTSANGGANGKPNVTFTVVGPTPSDTPIGSLSANAKGGNAPWPGTFNPGANGTTTPRSGSGSGTPNGNAASNKNSSGTNVNGTATPKRPPRHGRRVSLPINRLNSTTDLTQFDNVATPYDYSFILKILGELHSSVPVAALTTGASMLLALDADAGSELQRSPGRHDSPGAWVLERKRACRETVAVAWRRIGAAWGVAPVVELADRIINTLPEPFVVPEFHLPEFNVLLPDEPSSFVRDESAGESAAASLPLLDPKVIVRGFANSPAVQSASMRSEPELEAKFGARWTVENAIRESFERYSSPTPPPENAPRQTLMAIPNTSYQSLGRPTSRAVDVTDLRDALGASAAPASAAQSVVSSTHSAAPTAEKKARPDAKEILKDIFKDKKRA